MTGENFTVALARGFSRLNGVIVTLFNGGASGAKAIRDFHHKAGGAAAITKTDDSSTLACQLGARRVPEHPISSLAEHAYHLSELLNILHGESSMQISTRQYHSNKFLMAVNLEQLNGTWASISGINSHDSLLTVDV